MASGNIFRRPGNVASMAVMLLLSVTGCGEQGASRDELAHSVLQSARIDAHQTSDRLEAGGGEAVDFRGPASCEEARAATPAPSGEEALYRCSYRVTSTSAGPTDVSVAVTIYSFERSCWKGVVAGYLERLPSGDRKKVDLDQKQLDSGRFYRKGCVGD